ncbi:histidine phosphatase family protein [Paenibacillus thalictri]|uniref:Histidine phosphatase family protein n=1 Tax=Paenibacillus thalictri TaxID=2527873 RepID=A0A4Q9DS79_9BACL|nr:histidine phosphatase family protein [Paenibacillus thalictri]TBL79727.1 histidine phosphatase family protein [Paenibacillus thalictri]
MTTIGIIRHGTTEWNLQGRMQGQLDTPLAEVGIIQAKLLAKRLKTESWHGVITSDLMRAKATGHIIADELGIPMLAYDPGIRERGFGQLEGTTEEERVERFGAGWRERELELGMESDESLLSRGLAVLEDAAAAYPGQRILIISHGGIIVPMLKKLTNDPIERHLKNTSLSILSRAETGWNCELLNCTAHLDELG